MIAIDLAPTEEAQIYTIARKTGLEPAEYVKKVLKEHLPTIQNGTLAIDQENAAAIAQLQAWMKEEATNDPEEIRKADAEVKELMDNLNRNRIESGEKPLFSTDKARVASDHQRSHGHCSWSAASAA